MCCTVGKCCFCINLRAGAISIACICLLGDSLFLAWTSFVTYGLNKVVENMLSSGYWEKEPENRDASGSILLGVFWMTVVNVVIYSVAVPMDIMLLVGAITRRPRLLHGWMVSYAALYVLFLLVTALSLALTFFYNPFYGLAVTAGHLLHAGLTLYFWIVVRSYCLALGQQHGEGGPRSTAGRVYRTVPTGDVLPPHGTYGDAGVFPMEPTAPPRYTSSP